MAPALPRDAERLIALRALLILDTPTEQRFDRIVHFAANEFDMPMAVISLVDEDRQWSKSSVGIDVCETARDISFCGHAIGEPGLFLIADTLSDERFFDNPMVAGAPFVRFYVGALLRLSLGPVVVTLCLLDTKPRTFDLVDQSVLHTLRDLAVEELERRAEAQ